jgi:hypothetical protein
MDEESYMKENLLSIQESVQKLQSLLADPQPGLSTWLRAVSDALDAVAKHAPSYSKWKY